jgi:hypothetical protein
MPKLRIPHLSRCAEVKEPPWECLTSAQHGRMPPRCPPGVFCITPGFISVCALIVSIGVFVAYQLRYSLKGQAQQPQQGSLAIQIAAASGGGDDRYTRAPKPERHWVTEPDLPSSAEIYGKLPRVPTRGIPETYQSMGVIKTDDGQILPLYGRRTASRSDRFQYYTRTDSYNPVQLPIQFNRRDCQDDIGCEELSDRDSVTIVPTNQKGSATIYRFDGPTYVPGIL